MTGPGEDRMDAHHENAVPIDGDDGVLGAPPTIPDALWERVLATTFRAEDLDALDPEAMGADAVSGDGAHETADPDSFDHPFMIGSAEANFGAQGTDDGDD